MSVFDALQTLPLPVVSCVYAQYTRASSTVTKPMKSASSAPTASSLRPPSAWPPSGCTRRTSLSLRTLK